MRASKVEICVERVTKRKIPEFKSALGCSTESTEKILSTVRNAGFNI